MSWPWRAFSQVMRRWCTGSINYFLSQVSARATSRGPSSSTSHRNTFLLTFAFFLYLSLEVSNGEWAEDVGADPIYVQVTMHGQHPSPFPASYVHCHTPHQPHKLLKGAIYDASTPVSPTPYSPNWLQRQRTTSDEGNVFFIVVYNTETMSATPPRCCVVRKCLRVAWQKLPWPTSAALKEVRKLAGETCLLPRSRWMLPKTAPHWIIWCHTFSNVTSSDLEGTKQAPKIWLPRESQLKMKKQKQINVISSLVVPWRVSFPHHNFVASHLLKQVSHTGHTTIKMPKKKFSPHIKW